MGLGQPPGRKDRMIIEYERAGLELRVLCRTRKHMLPGADFCDEGRFRDDSQVEANPARCIVRRVNENEQERGGQ